MQKKISQINTLNQSISTGLSYVSIETFGGVTYLEKRMGDNFSTFYKSSFQGFIHRNASDLARHNPSLNTTQILPSFHNSKTNIPELLSNL